MKTYALVAIILIVVGIFALACQGITSTSGEMAVDFWTSQITAAKTSTIQLLRMGGALALLGGISLLVIGERKTNGLQYLSTSGRVVVARDIPVRGLRRVAIADKT